MALSSNPASRCSAGCSGRLTLLQIIKYMKGMMAATRKTPAPVSSSATATYKAGCQCGEPSVTVLGNRDGFDLHRSSIPTA